MTSNSKNNQPKQTISWGNDSKSHPRALGNNRNTVYRSTFRGGTSFTSRRHQWESTDATTQVKGNNQELGLNMALQMNLSTSIASLPSNTDSTTNFNIKTQPPMIEVYDYVESTPDTIVKDEPEAKLLDIRAPEYDHFQPMLANFSTTKDTQEMAACMVDTLQLLVNEGVIDFYEESKFVFAGRAYGEYGDCEYRISIFNSTEIENCKSVIEIRRSCGEAFTFANAESRILRILRKKQAIPQFENASNVNSSSETETPFASFTFGQLPDYSSLQWPITLPHYDIGYSDTDSVSTATTATTVVVTDDEQKADTSTKIEITASNSNNLTAVVGTGGGVNAELVLKSAVVSDVVQEEWRFDVAELKHKIEQNVEQFVAIEHIIDTLLQSINVDNNFDAFVTRTILQCITLLMDGAVVLPGNFGDCIKNIQTRWKVVVENQISANVLFKFAPSQQVYSECELILKKYSNIL